MFLYRDLASGLSPSPQPSPVEGEGVETPPAPPCTGDGFPIGVGNNVMKGLLFLAVAEVLEHVVGEGGEVGEGVVGGDVVLEGGYGYEVVFDGMNVGAGLGGPVGLGAVDPVVEASGVVTLVDDLRVGAVGEPRDLDALQLGQGFVGDVDVDERPGREEAGPGLGGEEIGHAGGGFEVDVVEGGNRDGERGNAAEESMKGSTDGSGDEDVVAEIGAGVDAGDEEVYGALDELFGGEDDAVAGGALYGVGPDAVPVEDGRGHADGVVEGDGAPDAALLPVRGNNYDFTYLLEALGEGPEAGGGYAVVVGYEDFQGRGAPCFGVGGV